MSFIHCIIYVIIFQSKFEHLSGKGAERKAALVDNSAYLQFMWKADVVESWIADKETHVRSEEFGRDLSTVKTLLTKQDTFDAGEFTHLPYNKIYLYTYHFRISPY